MEEDNTPFGQTDPNLAVEKPETWDSFSALLTEFVSLTRAKRDIDKQAKLVKGRLAAMEQPIVDQFLQGGIQNLNIDGMTVYLRGFKSAKPKGDALEFIHALEAHGLADIVSLGTGKLSALFRNTPVEDIPPEIVALCEVFEETKVGAREG